MIAAEVEQLREADAFVVERIFEETVEVYHMGGVCVG
jgi:hypothetical protein